MIALTIPFFKFALATVGLVIYLYLIYLYFCLSRKLVQYVGDRCSIPFQRFWNRQSKVFRQLFKDILASFMGTLILIYNADQDELFQDLNEPLSPYQKTPCEILPMSPKELLSPVPVIPRLPRRRPRIMMPRLIQIPIPVPS